MRDREPIRIEKVDQHRKQFDGEIAPRAHWVYAPHALQQMQGGVDKHQKYPIADPTRLEFQLQIPAMARRHLPDVARRRIVRRIRYKVVRMEPPTKPGLVRYLVVD